MNCQIVAVVALAALAAPSATAQKRPQKSEQRLAEVLRDDPTAAERLARMDGRYSMLLRQFPGREPNRRPIVEKGYRKRSSHQGHRDLPPGHWVWVRPYWFIFRDRAGEPHTPRPWGPEQATGAPNTATPGDRDTAWASKAQDSARGEWLLLEYSEPIRATAVEIHESFNPGAISKVTIFQHDAEELVVWEKDKLAPLGKPSRVLKIDLPLGFTMRRLRIELRTQDVPGWNEIDAVALVDDKGVRHWATAAAASSTFAGDRQPAGAILMPLVFDPAVPLPAARPEMVPKPLVPAPIPALTAEVPISSRVLQAELEQLRRERKALEERVDSLERELAKVREALEALRKERRPP